MANAQINITPFSGSETDNFNEFEQLITGAIGVAAIAAAQQANFLQLHLKGDALRYFLTLPEATRLIFADSITALRNIFTQDNLREIRIIKLENQKFNPKTDTVKNFLVKLRTEAKKAYPAPEIVVEPAGAGDPEARRFERETAARDSAIQMSENRKNEQIKRLFIKSMPKWLEPKLLERPDTDSIEQLCTLASQQIAIREMCNREEYFDDGFNEITESNTDKMLKAITTISNNQKELEQKLEHSIAPNNEPSEQGPVNIFTPHYPQQVYKQSSRQKFRPQNQNYRPNYRQFQQNYRPQHQYAPRANNYREFRPQFKAPRPFYYNEQPQTRNYWTQPSDSPPFVHPAYVKRPVYRFPTKNTPAQLLRQGIVYDSPAPAQNRYSSQQANQFNRASIPQNRTMRGMNYPFNQQKKLIKPPNFKKQNENNKNSVNYYNESTSSPSLDKVKEPVYKESNKKRRKRKRNSNKNKVNKSVQLPTQVLQTTPQPVTHV